MRRRVAVLLAGVFALAPVLPASASEEGSIDHIEADGGVVKMLFSVPASAPDPDLDSVSVSVSGRRVDATASRVEAGQVQRTTVLALDVSSSMRGDRFAAAKDAAVTYLAAAPEDVSIGLVTFAGEVTVGQLPTTDHSLVEQSVASLGLSDGTALYDGVLESLAQAGTEGQRDVLVLSDGADTTSTPLHEVVSAAERSGVGVSFVALEQSASAQERLRQISDATGGAVLPADDPQALTAVFRQRADALQQQVLIEFEAPEAGEVTVTAALTAGGRTYADSAFTSVGRSVNEPQAFRSAPIPVEAPSAAFDEKLLYAGAGTLGVGLAAVLGLLLAGRPRDRRGSLLDRQLAFYSATSQAKAGTDSPSRAHVNVRASAVAVADRIVHKVGFEERLHHRLTAAGVSLTTAEWLLMHAGVVIAGGLVGLLLGGVLTMVMLLGVGAVGPWLFLVIKATLRMRAFGTQLPDTLQLMAGGLSAGLSLPQSVDTVVREGSEPMAGELRRALVEQRLGVEIEDALDGVAGRMDSKDFAWVVMAVRIQREIGGNLAELLGTVAATIREREYLRRQVKTLSAEGRLSGLILGGLPPVLAIYLSLTRGDYLEPMYTTPLGWMMTISAVVLLTVGGFVMKSIVKVEV